MENLSVCEERAKKQAFLKHTILEKGYDPSEFQEFLERKKYDGGNNIDLWEFNDLKELVKEFNSKKASLFKLEDLEIINLNTSNINSPTSNVHHNNTALNISQATSIKSSSEQVEDKEKISLQQKKLYVELTKKDYNEKIQCRLLKENFLNDLTADNVEISSFEIQEGSIFSSSFAIYTISVKIFDWTVNRKLSDFQWLSDSLKQLFPCSFIPPLPKKTGLPKAERFYLEKKKILLEKFLHDIIKNPFLKSTQCFLDFLSKRQGELCDYKNATGFDGTIENVYHPSGVVTLKINEELNDFHIRATKYLNNTSNLYKEVQTLNKQLMLDFDQLSSTLFELGNVFSKLYSESLDFSNSVNTDKFQSLSDIYVNMNNFMVSWGNYFSGQMRNIQESMNVFFSYEKKYNIEMRILLSQRNKSADEYTVAIGKLESLMKEENGLPNIIRNSFKSFGAGKNFILDALENGLKIKDKFAYYNQGIYDELSKCLQDTLRRFSDNFIKFGRSQSVSIMELHVILADLLCNFEENETPNPQKKSLSIMKSICNSRNSSLNSSLNSSFQGNKGEEFIFS